MIRARINVIVDIILAFYPFSDKLNVHFQADFQKISLVADL